MNLLYALLGLSVALGGEAALGRWAPGALRYVDFMILPVAWYGVRGRPRAAMLAGCAAGLLRDTWFRTEVFGLGGFKKTLLGWILGGIGARFDLNHFPGRFGAGAALVVADGLLEIGLLSMLGAGGPWDPISMLIRAAVTGLLAAVVFDMLDRAWGDRKTVSPRHRRIGL